MIDRQPGERLSAGSSNSVGRLCSAPIGASAGRPISEFNWADASSACCLTSRASSYSFDSSTDRFQRRPAAGYGPTHISTADRPPFAEANRRTSPYTSRAFRATKRVVYACFRSLTSGARGPHSSFATGRRPFCATADIEVAFPAAGNLLREGQHVHVRVEWIDRVDRPLPDLRTQHRRRQTVRFFRPLPVLHRIRGAAPPAWGCSSAPRQSRRSTPAVVPGTSPAVPGMEAERRRAAETGSGQTVERTRLQWDLAQASELVKRRNMALLDSSMQQTGASPSGATRDCRHHAHCGASGATGAVESEIRFGASCRAGRLAGTTRRPALDRSPPRWFAWGRRRR